MIGKVPTSRLLNMTDQEKRWLENIKKVFFASDEAYQAGRPEDTCLRDLCNGIDCAATLRLSLHSPNGQFQISNNKKKFIEFIHLQVPRPNDRGVQLHLLHSREGTSETYTFGELVYDIRCMIHESENLNAAEKPPYHILLDWSEPNSFYAGVITDGTLTCNAHMVWRRLREILALFITMIDGLVQMAKLTESESEGSVMCTIAPPLGGIRPQRSSNA